MPADRMSQIEESMTLAITAKAKKMKAAGENVVIMASGEPDFDTPPHIKEAAKNAIDNGFTKYTAASGIDELKELICEKLNKENRLQYEKKNIVVTAGGKQAIFNAILALINPGDEAIVPSPYWVSYTEMIKFAQGKPVIIDSGSEVISIPALEKALTPKTRMIILNSPNNPSGQIMPLETIQKIADIAVKNKIFVISDEVYEYFLYDGKTHFSIGALNEEIKKLTITVNAFSKSYSMAGWRAGYSAAAPEIIKAMGTISEHSTSNPCSISQKAAAAALKGPQDCVKNMVAEFNKRRVYMVNRLNSMPGIKCVMPPGAFYAFPDVSALYGAKIKGSMDFCNALLENKKVAAIPGIGFGQDNYARFTYSASMADIEEGMNRLEEFVREISA